MSNTFLPAISEEPSKSFMDEDVFDENEFLETENENEGLVTPTKTKPDEALSTPQAPKKKPAMKKSIANAQNASNSVDPVQVGLPSKFDVLCGQSRICANHTGNCRFQVVLDIYASRYEAAKSKQEKMMLTKEIVGCIATSGGRFLKYKDGLWNEISSVTARDKVSHALRTKVQTRKKQQTAKPSSSAKKKGSTRKGRHCRRRSAPASSAHTNDLSEVRAVSFDGSDGSSTSSNAIMDDLLRAQREIFEQLTKGDKQTNTPRKTNQHPLKRTETWS
ncbi:unnamed protein product [Cylindrotheca closterium]|uniref:DUF6824 domain-containing protein n=1 Tax=Cylindrotheca closterium TaxID=2856 RepID=A0AAD2FBF6_9STRA|nr:unnamed protein product [Cylindrotheca closterium]